MRLMEEPVRQQNPFTSNGSAIDAKIIEQARIEMQTDFFFRAGKKIQEYDSKGDVIIPPPNLNYISFGKPKGFSADNKTDSLPINLIPKRPSYRKSKHGQNIRKTGEYYWVQVAAIELGRGEKWTHEMAIEARDKLRMASKMPPAEY